MDSEDIITSDPTPKSPEPPEPPEPQSQPPLLQSNHEDEFGDFGGPAAVAEPIIADTLVAAAVSDAGGDDFGDFGPPSGAGDHESTTSGGGDDFGDFGAPSGAGDHESTSGGGDDFGDFGAPVMPDVANPFDMVTP